MCDERVRISCVGLCRILDARGHYLLGLNQNRLQNGIRVLMALGGGYELFDFDVLKAWNGQRESDEPDLRFFTTRRHIDAVRAWFATRSGREATPVRELIEELVDEYAVLPGLSPGDLKTQILQTVERDRMTARGGVAGEQTHYFIEIHAVTFNDPAMLAQLQSAQATERGLFWVTADDIRRGYLAENPALRVDADVLLGK